MKILSILAIIAAAVLSGCTSVDNVDRASYSSQQEEGTIVFTRAAHYSPLFGTYSLNEVIEVAYEKVSRNEAGQLVVDAGIRYRGFSLWTNWFKHSPSRLTLRTVCNFYQEGGLSTPIIYSTNHQEIVINRGETFAFKVICPVKAAARYQIVLGD